MQRLTRFRFHLAHNLAREKSYFLSFLFLTFSSFGQVRPFGDPFGATSSAVLTELTTEELAQQSLADLATYLQTQGHGHFSDPQALAETLQQAARDAYRLDKVLAEPLRIVLSTTMANSRSLTAQLKALDKTSAAELQAIPQTLDSVPGLGPVWSAGLIAELGDVSRFADDDAIAQFAGLTWPAHESGQFQAEDTPLSQRGNRYLRYYLVEAANSVRRHCPEYADYYAAKYAQTPKHPHQRALSTARKLVRLLDALLRTQTLYQPPEQRPDPSGFRAACPAPAAATPPTPGGSRHLSGSCRHVAAPLACAWKPGAPRNLSAAKTGQPVRSQAGGAISSRNLAQRRLGFLPVPVPYGRTFAPQPAARAFCAARNWLPISARSPLTPI